MKFLFINIKLKGITKIIDKFIIKIFKKSSIFKFNFIFLDYFNKLDLSNTMYLYQKKYNI